MLNYLKQKLKERFDMKTYNVGLLQDQVYRTLKKQTNEILKDYNLISFDWAILGILYESKDGENSINLAEEIGVSQAFISKVLKNLELKKYLLLKTESDARYKKVFLTEIGRKNVEKIEPILKNKMKLMLNDNPITDLYGYINTLKKIHLNSQTSGVEVN